MGFNNCPCGPISLDFMSVKYGSLWYINEDCFRNPIYHGKIVEAINKEVERGKESNLSINHYFKKYTDPEFPPSWMLTEIMSFGFWSRVYSILHRKDRKIISNSFDLSPNDFESWIRFLTYIRNLCAHHARIFDRNFKINKPLACEKYKFCCVKRYKYAICAFILFQLLRSLNLGDPWLERLEMLIEKHNFFEIERMGLAKNWSDSWKNELSNSGARVLVGIN